MEKLLSESIIEKMTQCFNEEAGFDDHSGTGTVAPGTQGDTSTLDIAQQAPKVALAKTAISMSLPAMIGYTQPLQGPVGFVFGLIERKETRISHLPLASNEDEDQIISRKLVETAVREVKLQMTHEAATDIDSLFGDNFAANYNAFQKSGGEIWTGNSPLIAKFFLNIGMRRMANKINFDFVNWLHEIATKKGTVDLATYAESTNIFGVIGELREALFKATQKSGKPWILVSPRIAAFMSSTLGSSMSSGATSFEQGRVQPQDRINGYVLTMGDIDVYQYDFSQLLPPDNIEPSVTGGMAPVTDSEDIGKIFMGYQGIDEDSASVYYCPYKEYLIQTEDYNTGQPTIWYKVRDAFITNPLDSYDDTMAAPQISAQAPNTSSFIMSCDVTYAEKMIQP